MVTDAKVKAKVIKKESESVFIFSRSKMWVKGHVNGDNNYVGDIDGEQLDRPWPPGECWGELSM